MIRQMSERLDRQCAECGRFSIVDKDFPSQKYIPAWIVKNSGEHIDTETGRGGGGGVDYPVGRYRCAIAGGETGTFSREYMKLAHRIRTRGSFFFFLFPLPFYFLFAFVPLSHARRRPVQIRTRDKARMCVCVGTRIGLVDYERIMESTWPHKSVCHLSRCVYRPSFSPSRRAILEPRESRNSDKWVMTTVMKVSGVYNVR